MNNSLKTAFIAVAMACLFPVMAAAQAPLVLRGIAHNLSAHATSGISFTVSRGDDGKFSLKGSFDGNSLFGTFTASQRLMTTFTDGSGIYLVFDGTLTVGGPDRSGFPAGTTGYFRFYLSLTKASSEAAYLIGPLGSFVPYEQAGTVDGYMNHYILDADLFDAVLEQ